MHFSQFIGLMEFSNTICYEKNTNICVCVSVNYVYQGGTDDECEVVTSKKTGYLTRVCMETNTDGGPEKNN
ncbi:hypothetical protein HanRHA438_Chr12g0545451 [Helianthus annuus]|nr:hypothetical protein HanRHA438_Chr12g0545451 [Helianthus annuus]